MGGGGGGGGGLGGLAGAIAAAQAARNAGNSVHSALGMSKSQPGTNNNNNSSAKPPTPGGGGMTAREMLGHANKARMAGNQIHSALGLRDPPSASSASPSHSSGGPPPPPPPPPPGGPGGVDFAELKRGVGGMLGVGKSVGTPMLRNAGERAGGESRPFQRQSFGSGFGSPSDHRQTGTERKSYSSHRLAWNTSWSD